MAFDHMLEGIKRGGVIGKGGVDVQRSCFDLGMDLIIRESMFWNQRKSILNL